MERAVEVLATELETAWIAAAGIVNVAHTGRIGAFAERIAAGPTAAGPTAAGPTAAGRGCLALILGGGGHATFANVAPFGGTRGVHSTNPYALALPGGRHGTVVVDFATSATAQGKLMVARMKGEAVPEGLILDKTGRPTTDPRDFYDGGALLPAAGPKGYGLGLLAELIGSALLAAPHEFNWLILALKLKAFRDPADYAAAAEAYLARVKACPPAEGFSEVHLPGEIERVTEAERRRDGIPLGDDVWAEILAAGRGVGVEA
jgi:LDH2 family malate/lactate/ureidoglycolate dehydrogenase